MALKQQSTKEKKKPTTVEEAIALISVSKKFNNKADYLIKNILGAHIDMASSEYKPIREDAIGSVVANLFDKIAKGETDSEWYQDGLSSYDTNDCALTRYMYTCVRNYASTRFNRWSDIKLDAKGGARARDVVPFDVDETDGGVEDWLSRQVSELPNSDIETAATQKGLSQILHNTSLSNEVISIVLMKCESHTYDEIGKKLGLSEDAIRMKFNRAKPILNTALAKL